MTIHSQATSAISHAGNNYITWQNAMGSLCRIGETPKDPLLEVRLKPAASEYKKVMRGIWPLRKKVYREHFPEVCVVKNDPYDRYSCVIYTRAPAGRVTSTVRIAFDGELGIPEAALVPGLVGQYRRAGIRFAELGRFVIDGDTRGPDGPFKNYYRAYYELGKRWGIEVYLIFVPENKMPFYRRLMDAELLSSLDGLTFGGQRPFVCMEWWLDRTRSRFFSWCGAENKYAATNPLSGKGGTL